MTIQLTSSQRSSTVPSAARLSLSRGGGAHAELLASKLIGESPQMRAVRKYIARIAGSRLPVVIEGPTGAGKEVVAECIHRCSERSGAFVAFNVCEINESMFEDALFGHVRGAFTGAVSDRSGYLAEANGGTLFLDEISGLSLHMQQKLLRAMELGSYRPVGAVRDRQSDFRIVAATNEPLSALIATGRFRQDLAYRIANFTVQLPPLRSRVGDAVLLARHFAAVAEKKGVVEPDVAHVLGEYEWPGNVRELKATIEAALVLSENGSVSGALVSSLLARGWQRATCDSDDGQKIRQSLRALLESCDDDVGRAAGVLGVHPSTLYHRMKRSGLAPPRRRGR